VFRVILLDKKKNERTNFLAKFKCWFKL